MLREISMAIRWVSSGNTPARIFDVIKYCQAAQTDQILRAFIDQQTFQT
jgi:hypothetical protein